MNILLERVLKLPKDYITKDRYNPFHHFPQSSEKTYNRIAVAAFFFCQGLCFATWASRIPDLKLVLRLSEAMLGSILLALPIGQMTAMPFSGRIVAKYGSKKTLSIGFFFYALALTNIGLSQSATQLAIALFLFGVAGNMCNISVNTQAVGVEKLYGRTIMSSFHGVWSTAGFLGALLGIVLINLKLTPYEHFWIVASLGIVITLIAQRYLVGASSTNNVTNPPTEKKSFFSMPDAMLVKLGIIGFCCMAAEGTMFDWSGVYFQHIVQAKGAWITLGYAAFMVTMASGRFVGDKLQLQWGKKKMLQLSGVLITTGLLLAVSFPYLLPATLGFVIVGFGVSSVIPMVYSTAGKSTKMAPSVALAAVSSISYLGFLLGPPIIGFIAEATDLRFSFATIAVLGGLISLIVSKTKVIE